MNDKSPDLSQFSHPPVDSQSSVSQNQDSSDQPVMHELNLDDTTQQTGSSMKKNSMIISIFFSLVAVAAGIATGYGGYKLQNQGSPSLTSNNGPIQQVAEGSVKEGDTFGSNDTGTFKDNAQGYLEIGGIDGEGSHKLLRPGGDSQTVFLTSSITDLDKFDGMEVKIWGETFKGQNAGWLMDVGRVEIVKVKGQNPGDKTGSLDDE